MTFYSDQLILVEDSLNNIYMFQRKDKSIELLIFNHRTQEVKKKTIVKNILRDYDVSIDDFDNIYMVYQDTNYNLIQLIFEENRVNKIKLTKKTVSLIYNLNIINYNGFIHVFYCNRSSNKEDTYVIYHNLYDGQNWFINKLDEIQTLKLLNPFQIAIKEDNILIGYYDFVGKKEIYLRCYNSKTKIWEEEKQLTNSRNFKLYLDFIVIEDKLNLVYSENVNGNYVIKYERFKFENNTIIKEIEEIMSNPENCSHPTIVYYDRKIWIIWLEHNNILSRYSKNKGENWSPIYLWNESKNENIIKYKFIKNKDKNNRILNSSFGKIYPEVSFIGFGPLDNVTKIPLKNKIKWKR